MDFTKFGLTAASATSLLANFGWRSDFDRQIDDDDRALSPARITAVHRNALRAEAPALDLSLPHPSSPSDPITIGDWVLVNAESRRLVRRLGRINLLQRKAAGTEAIVQPIAANVDTLFVVTSCNADFSEARLERYLAAAGAGGVSPVVLLTKSDLAEPDRFIERTRTLMRGLLVEPIDGRDPATRGTLEPWLGTGQTVAFVGSSGVGKSTLVNTLLGQERHATAGIREDDAKGRHTTTRRSLLRLPGGAWVADTPGMREFGLTDSRAGLDAVFSEIDALARNCRFSDCAHDSEPGCAVQAAVASGALNADRLRRWQKLMAEDRRNSETAVQRRARDRSFGKLVRSIQRAKR